nr:kinesin-like protein KIN-12D [Tanacetum cinerariifolium]
MASKQERGLSSRGPSACSNSQDRNCFQGFKDVTKTNLTYPSLTCLLKFKLWCMTINQRSRYWGQWMIKLNPMVLLTTLKNLEKNASRTRGSGSPFKCMGIGLAQ